MTLGTSDYIAIIGIAITAIIGLIALMKKNEGKNNNNVSVEQKSSLFSKANQKQNVNVNISND